MKLKLNKKEYIIYKIELYMNFKRKELKEILNYEYNSEYDREKMKMKLNMNEWICLGDNEVFIEKMYEKEEKE